LKSGPPRRIAQQKTWLFAFRKNCLVWKKKGGEVFSLEYARAYVKSET